MQMRKTDIACSVNGDGESQHSAPGEKPRQQALQVIFGRPGWVDIWVNEDGTLGVYVYENLDFTENNRPKGGFGINEGENDSWVWPKGKGLVTVDKVETGIVQV